MKPKKSKAEQCRNLRYKKPALMDLGYYAITEKLDEIQEVCGEIHWAFDDDETVTRSTSALCAGQKRKAMKKT